MISLKNTLKAISSKFSALNTLLNDVPHYTLLWTNPNPTSSFSAQTISLDLSKYDAVEISFRRWSTETILYTQRVLEKNAGVGMSTAADNFLSYRCCLFTDSGVTFDPPYYYPDYAGGSWTLTQRDTRAYVPYKIYGIKFGGGV